MTLEEKINNINIPQINELNTGKANTLEAFWSDVIQPNLISYNTAAKWCDLLFRYIEDTNVIYAIRTFNNRGKNQDKDLRRGFYTNTNQNYGFFYTDNYFSAFFCKMALDNYVPAYTNFKKMFISRTFPARFGQSCKAERDKASFKINAKDPQINKAGYKISHIIDVGSGYYDGITEYKISDICAQYFPRGIYDDWKEKKDEYGVYFVRELEVPNHALEYLKAIFLRITCPLNYILTPKRKFQLNRKKIEKNDIGEDSNLIQYAMYKFSQQYGQYYTEFLKRIMTNQKLPLKDNGNFHINIEYGFNITSQESISQTSSHSSVSKSNSKTPPLKLSDKKKADCLKAYLFDGLSFRQIESQIMGIESKARGGGFKAQTLMRHYNIPASQKGIFKNLTYNEACLRQTTPPLREILDYIKQNS